MHVEAWDGQLLCTVVTIEDRDWEERDGRDILMRAPVPLHIPYHPGATPLIASPRRGKCARCSRVLPAAWGAWDDGSTGWAVCTTVVRIGSTSGVRVRACGCGCGGRMCWAHVCVGSSACFASGAENDGTSFGQNADTTMSLFLEGELD